MYLIRFYKYIIIRWLAMSLLFVAESSYMTRKTLTQCMYHFFFFLFFFFFWIKVAFKKSGGAKFMHIMQCKTEIRIEKKNQFSLHYFHLHYFPIFRLLHKCGYFSAFISNCCTYMIWPLPNKAIFATEK